MCSEYFRSVWNAYKKNLPVLVLAVLLIGVIGAIITIPFAIPLAQYAQSHEVILTDLNNVLNQGSIESETLQSYLYLFEDLALRIGFIFLGLLIAMLFIFPLKVGLTKLYQMALQEKKVKLSLMFNYAKKKFKSSLGSVGIMYLIELTAIIVSSALFIVFAAMNVTSLLILVLVIIFIGNILVKLFMSLASQALAVSDSTAPNSISMSFNTVKKNLIEFLGIVIIFFVTTILLNQLSRINYLEFIVLLFLAFVIGPIKGLVYTKFYMTHNEKKKVTIKKTIKKSSKSTRTPKIKK